MEKKNGLFSWSELMTTDFDKSFEFYTNLFGWTLKEVAGRKGTRYALVMNENTKEPFAGIITMPEGQLKTGSPSFWQTYVTVDDINQTIDKATSLGARIIVDPMPIDKIGTIAVIKDPQGAVISIINYK